MCSLTFQSQMWPYGDKRWKLAANWISFVNFPTVGNNKGYLILTLQHWHKFYNTITLSYMCVKITQCLGVLKQPWLLGWIYRRYGCMLWSWFSPLLIPTISLPLSLPFVCLCLDHLIHCVFQRTSDVKIFI